MKKNLLRALILGALSLASVSGQSLQEQAFSLWNWGKSVYLDNLTSADGVLTLIADGTHLFRSLDLGKSWRAFPLPQDGAFGPFWQRVQFDPTAGLYYVTAVGAIYTAAPRASGWTRLFEGGLSFYSVDGETFAFNGWPNDGINVSRDGGRTWKSTDRFAANGGGGLPFAAGACVYVTAGEDPISVSCDGGATWKTSVGDTLSNSGRSMIRHEGAVIALTDRGLVRSVDNGKTWARWRGNLLVDSLAYELTSWGNSLFLFTPTGAHRSIDGGRSWTALASPDSGQKAPQFSRDLVEAGGALFIVARQGLMTSTDGGRTWSMVTLRSILSPIQSLAVAGNRVLAQAEEGIFVSGDSGTTWEVSLPAVDGNAWTAFAGSDSLYAAGSQDGKIRITADAGVTWSRPYPLPSTDPVTGLAGFDGSILANSAGRLWRLSAPDSVWSAYPLPAADGLRFIASGSRALLLAAASHLWEMVRMVSFPWREHGTTSWRRLTWRPWPPGMAGRLGPKSPATSTPSAPSPTTTGFSLRAMEGAAAG